MKTVLCFGNEFIKEDSLAKEIADELFIKNVRFVKCDNLSEILEYREENLYILDVAEGIDEVKVIEDIDNINTRNIISLHDFDLGYFLRLMKENGKIKKIRVIAIPFGFDKDKAKEELRKVFSDV